MVEEWIEKFWPLISGFIIAGGTWFWQNKKTKLGKALEKEEVESKEITNMKELMALFQDNFRKELVHKDEVIDKLSLLIRELNLKIDSLEIQVKNLNNRLDYNTSEVIKIAKKCKNAKTCQVLESLKAQLDIK